MFGVEKFSIWGSWIKGLWMGFLGIMGFRGYSEGKGLQAWTHNRPGISSFPLLGTREALWFRGGREGGRVLVEMARTALRVLLKETRDENIEKWCVF